MGARDFIGSLFLRELFKGMAVTGVATSAGPSNTAVASAATSSNAR